MIKLNKKDEKYSASTEIDGLKAQIISFEKWAVSM